MGKEARIREYVKKSRAGQSPKPAGLSTRNIARAERRAHGGVGLLPARTVGTGTKRQQVAPDYPNRAQRRDGAVERRDWVEDARRRGIMINF